MDDRVWHTNWEYRLVTEGDGAVTFYSPETGVYTFRKDGRQRAMSVRPELEGALRQAIENGRALEALMVECGIATVRAGRTGR